MAPTLHRWTELHTGAALLAVTAAAASAAVMSQSGAARPVLVGLVVVTVVAGLLTDGFLGLGVGVATAAAGVVTIQRLGTGDNAHFTALVMIVGALVVLGWVAGLLGASARAHRRALERGRPADVQPALASLGLLPADVAELRADEEIARARRHDRPLAVVALEVEPRSADVDEALLQATRRAVARLVEHRLRRSDAPFALDAGSVAAVLPETDERGAAALAGLLVQEAPVLSVRDRGRGGAVEVGSVATLRCAVVELAGRHTTASDLLDEARAALRDEQPAEVVR
ncbi:hypothetical protein [Arsenicicoccus bolidensis]|uniref:hypothetical protein n=1 Tax=Arsenicicoccus bolidensis TaxID=229480 RepID=UPI00040C04C9|nr:hypothetical protein [Arsenicicoccus bolidensis]